MIIFARTVITSDFLEFVSIEAIVFEIVDEKVDFFFEEGRSGTNAISPA